MAAEAVGGGGGGHHAPGTMAETRERCDGRFSRKRIP